MQSSLDAIRLGAGLPERIAARIQLLLASAPDPASALAFSGTAAPGIALGAFDRICEFAGRPALRGAPLLLQRLSFRVRAAESGADPAGGQFRQLLSRALGGGVRERLFEFLGQEDARACPSAVDLARFRRRQLLRIVLRDVLGVATLSDVTAGAFEPGRRDSGRGLPPHPRGVRGAARRAAPGRMGGPAAFR